MTCIVALKKDGRVYMGGDSAVTIGYQQQISTEPKVFQVGEFLIGAAGNARNCQIANHWFNPPEQSKNQSDLAYMCTSFAMALQEAFTAAGVDFKADSFSVGLIVGYRGELYSVGADFSMTVLKEDYMTEGSGGEIAAGAMAILTSHLPKMKPHLMVTAALTASCRHNWGVLEPFVILSI